MNKKNSVIVLLVAILIMTLVPSSPVEKNGHQGGTKTETVDYAEVSQASDTMKVGFDWRRDALPIEGLAGIAVSCNGSKVAVSKYVNTKKSADAFELVDIRIDTGKSASNGAIDAFRNISAGKSEKRQKITDNTVFDLKDEKDGLYHIISEWKIADKDRKLIANIVLKNGKAQVCDLASETFQNTINKIDPKDCLDIKHLTYPTSGYGDRCVQVDEWTRKGQELINELDPDASDAYKVLAFAKHLSAEYAFDAYRTTTLRGVSRANNDQVFNNDNYFMYYNKVGVCWDFANALAIMCRSNGIPATSLENSRHTVALVYIDGRWRTIDINESVEHICETKDTNPKYWKKKEHFSPFGVDSPFTIVGTQIWTYENAIE